MIILKYLNKQLLLSVFAVSLILMLVLITSRLIKYISEVASGDIALKFLVSLIAFRLPDILLMVLPASLLLAILLVFGRMYLDSEMAVFFSSGISIKKLSLYAMPSILLVALMVAALSLFIAPWGLQQIDKFFVENANRTAFDTLSAGRFSPLGKSGLSLYTKTLSADRKVLGDVFIAREASSSDPSYQIVAKQGQLEVKGDTLSRYLILINGYRYEGTPGTHDYRVTQFDTFGIKLSAPPVEITEKSTRGQATQDLLNLNNSSEIAELQWRISMPLLVLVIALLGIPLSRVNPRQGRFYFLIPAMLFYFTYLVTLSGMKTAVEQQSISPWLGLWWVHLMFVAMTVILFSNIHHKFFALFNLKLLPRK